jgi:hypothetical protein
MSEERSPEAQRVYEEIEASIREGLKDVVGKPCNRVQVVAACQRVLAEQVARIPAGEVVTHALVAPARVVGRPWLWGLPCCGVPEVPDDRVFLARFTGVTAPPEMDAADPTKVTLTVGFDVLRVWPVTWPAEGEPEVAGLIPVEGPK